MGNRKWVRLPVAVLLLGVMLAGFGGMCQKDDNKDTVSGSSAPGYPDLMDSGNALDQLIPYPTVHYGDQFQALCMVGNNSDNDAGFFYVDLYASANSTISTSDYFLKRLQVTSMSAWDSDVQLFDVASFPSSIPTGNYYIGFIIDPTNIVGESNESNNTGLCTANFLTVSSTQTLNIYTSKDTYVSSGLPDQNFGNAICLKLYPNGSFDGEYRIYVYFDLSQIPANAVIEEAKIHMLNLGGAVNNSSTLATCSTLMLGPLYFGSSTSWVESSLTWNSSLNTAVTNYLTGTGTGSLFNIQGPNGNLTSNVTNEVQYYVNGNTAGYNGWVITTCGNNYNEYKTFGSSDYSGYTPYITIKYH